MSRFTEEEIDEFMKVLLPIQWRLMAKYGRHCIERWREERLAKMGSSEYDLEN